MSQLLYSSDSTNLFESPILFTIGIYTFETLVVSKFIVDSEPLDGPGAGRTQAPGAPLRRDPIGLFKNIELEIWMPDTSNPQFMNLLRVFDGFGTKDFEIVSFAAPFGVITQLMYGSGYRLVIRRQANGITYYEPTTFKFVAQKGTI